jgi:hypothetical protein
MNQLEYDPEIQETFFRHAVSGRILDTPFLDCGTKHVLFFYYNFNPSILYFSVFCFLFSVFCFLFISCFSYRRNILI